jgi:hypothetical protein
MPSPDNNKFFLIHVMKTGGTSLADIIAANFAASERYPDACVEPNADIFRRFEAYLFVPGLVSHVNAMNGQLRMVRGHVPYAVRTLLHDSYIAMTLLRDPVERTLSYLKHCRRYHTEHQHLELEQIYEDPWFQSTFIQNYQTKIFSMSAQESMAEERLIAGATRLPPRRELGDEQRLSADVKLLRDRSPGRFSLECFAASTGVINVDEKRLATAKENLSAVEVIGVTERYDQFLKKLIDRYDWRIKSIPYRHVGERDRHSVEFRDRIAVDNGFDMELYEHARLLSA